MEKKKIDNWEYSPQMENLLFFAYILDEMTFNYTLDSFKASVHNIFSLIRECINTIDDIKDATIKEGALPPIIEEIKDTLDKDTIMAEVCNQCKLELLIPKIDKNTDLIILKTTLEMFISSQVVNLYNNCIKSNLSETIKDEKLQKKKIEKLARLFVSQMKYMGYPNASIYKKNKDFFFSRTHIRSINDIDAFLSRFDFKMQKYTVCLFGNKLYKFLNNSLHDVGIEINNTFVPSQWRTKFAEFDSLRSKAEYILVEIEGYDEYAAMMNAISKVVHYTSLFTFFHHKETFIYTNNWSLVRRNADGICYKVKMPMAQMLACQDERKDQASELYEKYVQKLVLDKDSFIRFEKSVLLHDSALRSDHEENQFLNLFIAFEVLIPKAANSGKDRIVQISDVLLPYLCHSHFLKLAASFGKDFRLWNNKLYNSILVQIVEGSADDEKMCALITLAKYQKLREQIFEAAHNDNHVLLQYRLYKLNERMGNAENVKSTYNKFLERMRWHIARLYRTRNLIAHAGTRPYFLDMLLENIHAFYDTFMRELIIDIANNRMLKLEYSYILRQSRHDDYLYYLKSLPNSTIIDESNYTKVLGVE